MPSMYQSISAWFLAHRPALVALIVLVLVGLPLSAVARDNLPRWSAGVVGICWWLVLAVVWFRADRPDKRPMGVDGWLYAGFLDLFFLVGVRLLLAGWG